MSAPAARPARDYARVGRLLRPGPTRETTMAGAVDILWEALAPTGVSWLGFYTKPSDRPEMILGARRDKPACSPLGMHGICGRCYASRRPIVVKDAKALTTPVNPEGGAVGYIACDPNDRAEVVIPLLEGDGSCWGVLDLDSHEADVFDDRDAQELTRLMEQVGLSAPSGSRQPAMHL